LTYKNLEEAIDFIDAKPKPLALYFFSNNRQKQEEILQSTSSGSVCLNDILLHLTVAELPFGGVGESGMGRYHGKASFDTFSNYKSVLRRPFWGETNLRYPPYGNKANLIKKFFS
jgi:aldehyde dehydrogenase (NAD+)